MRRLASIFVFVLLAGLADGGARAGSIEVKAVPVPLQADDPKIDRVGKLLFRGGVELTSPNDHFGGFSALGLSPDGKRMVALSDEGARFDARLVYGADGRLTGVAQPEMFTLTGPGAVPLIDKALADAEAMAPGVNGEIIVAFERTHRIWAYPAEGTGPRPLPLPAELKGAPANAGIEALTLLDTGALFAISEGQGRSDTSLAWVSHRGGWSVLLYRTADSYRPTGAATLPNGDVVVVERFYTPRDGARARVRRIAAGDIKAGADVSGALLADIKAPFTVDNFEGIEAIKGPRGETLLFLMSDDNFKRMGPQRTLLMMFELLD